MEELIRDLVLGRADERGAAKMKRPVLISDLALLIPDIAFSLYSCLLASYSPFEGISPFGMACVLASWYSGPDPYFACFGAALGYFLSGNYPLGSAAVLLGVGIFAVNSRKRLKRIYRLLAAFVMESVLIFAAALIFRKNVFLLVGSATVSVFCAVVLSSAVFGLRSLTGGRSVGDTELITLSAAAGLAVLAMRNFSLFGQSPAVIFACVCVLFSAYRLGVPCLAAAVALGAGRILATGSDMQFIAVLSACALISAAFRSLGKTACALSFFALSASIKAVLGGNGVIGYVECGFACLIFMLVPARLYVRPEVKKSIAGAGKKDPRLLRLEYRVASLSDVLKELSRVCGGDDGKMLSCISHTLRRSLSAGCFSDAADIAFDCGKAESLKSGSSSSGDSSLVRELDGKLLVAISDGMGSGEEARLESRSALALLSDLISVGFGLEEAAELVNRLLIDRSVGDMYATLDVMLVDLSDGSALFKKHGAPTTCILRDGGFFTISGEALPVGIIDSAGGEIVRTTLLDGDTVVMMSDGLADALGNDCEEAVRSCVAESENTEKAAERLLDEALSRGADDDMTVIVTGIIQSNR